MQLIPASSKLLFQRRRFAFQIKKLNGRFKIVEPAVFILNNYISPSTNFSGNSSAHFHAGYFPDHKTSFL